ncbi:uncharacterized protein B0I36DRAFT_316382 [Microdochium trichocladiopsis]|uniref:Geminivirus AL1 replication-associated protein central domain-containing protein n=1 Tax=Microdochium trichocladiopsis TaxID=1682393 RepID=A0A9P8YFE0_9PEZI|nr:uncharacterized protein B0I36DRAFT_316205 [Microdochium trichocladiopsis]XP_046017549.1 uncharacterized protein B0I36DRAFT_316223 [Microdochium trichocladiopsis]XP_046017556.1 uncharacterized protein B0I36DRAFT_316241 [Microdochium trichocladiopsis]XP_046017595.1 uncharacterized protein B0I36DRAFT_316382 [Microdochium trichocladiopsis]KAH7038422.1 hypothetical protein B0I36DRAFT_316205 [Microdochium trichocladiopsis]KAH7038428.1 hypothetical protein B0I36DRAFT_316223 [Microdochium trichocla
MEVQEECAVVLPEGHEVVVQTYEEDEVPDPAQDEWADIRPNDRDGEKVFILRTKYFMLTYSKSQIMDVSEFEKRFRETLRRCYTSKPDAQLEDFGVQYFGSRELHASGRPHYHVVVALGKPPHWRDPWEKLRLLAMTEDGLGPDTRSVRLSVMRKEQNLEFFLNKTQAYVRKESWDFVFGREIEAVGDRAVAKRKREELCIAAIKAETAEEVHEILAEGDPVNYVWRHTQACALANRKRRRFLPPVGPVFHFDPVYIPQAMLEWKAKWIDQPYGAAERPQALVLTGPTRTGKTAWAESFGNPLIVNTNFRLDDWREDCTHIVLNDVVLADFKYTREMLGCQRWFNGTDKFKPTVRLALGKPVIWTCNEDNNPLRKKVWRKYAEDSVVQVKVTCSLFKKAMK